MGFGGAAAADWPAVAGFFGGRMADAAAITEAMGRTVPAPARSGIRLPIADLAAELGG